MVIGLLLWSVGVTSWPRRARPLFGKQPRHAALFISTAFHPTVFSSHFIFCSSSLCVWRQARQRVGVQRLAARPKAG